MKNFNLSPIFSYFIFYGWNILFFFTMLTVEISEQVFSNLVYAVFTAYTPASYLINTLLLFIIPLLSFFLGIYFFGLKPHRLLRWFYGFEVPLVMLSMFRIFGFQELTGAVGFWITFFNITILGYGAYLIWKDKIPTVLRQILHVFRFSAGILLTIFLLIYAVPLAWVIIKNVFEIDFLDLFNLGFLLIVLFLFFVFTGSLFLASPIAFFLFYVRDGWRELRSEISHHGSWKYTFPLALAIIALLLYPVQQPQKRAFALNHQWEKGKVENEEILQHSDEIRMGFVNAYLQNYRYLGRKDNDRELKSLYKNAFGGLPEIVSITHDFLISPFLYDGEWEDVEKAAHAYESLFDEPIERAERKSIINAMSASHLPRRVEAGILNIDQKQVKVTERDLDFIEKGEGMVELEFHERYINQTYSEQEIFYYFSLPGNCVITGLWLSDDDNDLKKYPYIIAPRGAAQATYQEIRARRRDPALLEQVGPYQYRLRVFPIPPRIFNSLNSRTEGDNPLPGERPMHITLKILSAVDKNGKISLPQLTEKRNVYWEDGLAGCAADQWFPEPEIKFPPAGNKVSGVIDGVKASVKNLVELDQREVNEEFIICVDGSFSMNQHLDLFRDFWNSFPYKDQSQLYLLMGEKLMKLKSQDPKIKNLLGVNDPFSALRHLSIKHPQKRIIWISDKGNYEMLPQDLHRKPFESKAIIDVIHLNGFAAIYEDAFIESIIASGGQVYRSGGEWLEWVKIRTDEKTSWRDGDQLYLFEETKDTSSGYNPTDALLASRYVMARSKSENDIVGMEKLHTLAMKYSFVSPFSSMICLVNEEQKKLLNDKTAADDRFDREVETGKVKGEGGVLDATGVPEPHEWVLIIFGFGLLIYLYRDRIFLKFKSN